MFTIVLVPILVMLLGLFLWVLAPDKNPTLKEIGKIMFCVGLLVAVWRAPGGQEILRSGGR